MVQVFFFVLSTVNNITKSKTMPAESFSDKRLDETIGGLTSVFLKEFNVINDKDVEWLLFSFAPGRVNYIG